MKPFLRALSLTLTFGLGVACDTTEEPSRDLGIDQTADAGVDPDASLPSVTVSNTGEEPFARSSGAPSFFGATRFVASSSTTISVFGLADGRADSAYLPMVLTSTQFGGNASGAVAVYSEAGDDFAFFLPTGEPQVGAIDLAPPGRVLSSSVLAEPLEGGFSADMLVRASMLYVADAPFGQGSIVRAYGLAGFDGVGPLQEDRARRFTLPVEDLDGDGSDELLVAGRLQFSDDGEVGFVAFTVLGNSAPALAGGVLAFDPARGLELGRVLVPTADSSTIAQGFVGGFVVAEDRVYVVTAEKQFVPSFGELGGHLSIYEIVTRRPFLVRDTDASLRYDQPLHRLSTSDDNPTGIALFEDLALVVNAPFFLEGTLDVFDVGARARLHAAHPLGGLYQTGYYVPADPRRVPGTRRFLLGTEAGALQFEVGSR
jgi:hypothetical protein